MYIFQCYSVLSTGFVGQCNLSFFVFAIKLKLGDGALRIEVNNSAVNLPSSEAAHIYSCLQKHIIKLQVKWLHT